MLKKTIKINPELFNIGDKTRKIREKKQRPSMPLVVKPNSLKKELLNRIKEHRNKEIEPSGKPSFSDEFHDSINYLSTLSKKHKDDADKERRRELMANRTVKNYSSYNNPNPNNSNNLLNISTPTYQSYQSSKNSYMVNSEPMVNYEPMVNLELPEELQETYAPVLIEPTSAPLKINTYSPINDVPYGCLKGGSKPTFRAWQSTRKNYDSLSNPTSTTFSSSIMPSRQTEQPQQRINITEPINDYNLANDRERKLELLRIKMKKQEEDRYLQQQQQQQQQQQATIMLPPPDTSILNNSVSISKELKQNIDELIPPPEKKFIKRTIKRKYTLGKSKIYNTVSILLKDNQTRKNVLNAHKELKRTPINDVKKYLKTRGLIKVGSNAPNDVLRKTYESAMLAGEVLNKNKDTLLHNFLHDTAN